MKENKITYNSSLEKDDLYGMEKYFEIFKVKPHIFHINIVYKIPIKDRLKFYNELINMGFSKFKFVSNVIGWGRDNFYVNEEMNLIISDHKILYNPNFNYSHVVKKLGHLFRELFRNKIKDETGGLNFISNTPNGFNYCRLVNKIDKKINIETHYNDSLIPIYNKMVKDLRIKDSASLFIFRSEPGCGKTTLLKKLIYDLNDKSIFYINSNDVGILSDPSFIEFAVSTMKNSILIIEDGETVVKKRNGSNNVVSNILNLTDGFLKDLLNLKIIITLNCDIGAIDPALLRKGRLNVLYEFDKLSVDKCKALGFDVNEPKTLAELYCSNDIVVKDEKRIGFN